MENVYVGHPASRSSDGQKIFGEFTFNQKSATMTQMFDVTKKIVSEQTEIHGKSVIIWQDTSWKRTTLLNDRTVQLSTAKAYVFSESVLRMERIPNTLAIS